MTRGLDGIIVELYKPLKSADRNSPKEQRHDQAALARRNAANSVQFMSRQQMLQ